MATISEVRITLGYNDNTSKTISLGTTEPTNEKLQNLKKGIAKIHESTPEIFKDLFSDNILKEDRKNIDEEMIDKYGCYGIIGAEIITTTKTPYDLTA